mmetsp:Transcript_14985/g.42341  ORF Transcript_14985/g.42341 Transcript_14985/m.42341 type:complete len:147 (+) Transcript_14985:72-512(+)|eukprot:CAMPEP_0119561580 /NCGR_PEP_ID=MMETSP1352-20130426/18025_1 /TAXON_ID=265584 /ORGANISM="Stauroneis constricta, Strain CCMP1120" /LENGTH=146 /DNA_ID=CAMNT_0007609813 /DNA_START=26 /DNA_END=466 /DNA_ORIENTATION=+
MSSNNAISNSAPPVVTREENGSSSRVNGANNDDGEIRADELSRRMFWGGCLGLPWLWIVHTFYWHGQQRAADQTLLDSREQDQSAMEDDEIVKMKQREWVRRGRNGAMLVTTVWFAWIAIAQIFLDDLLPNFLYVRSENYADRTGW